MKLSSINRIERMLEEAEARLVPPARKVLWTKIWEGDDLAAAQEKALAEHVACHPEDAGRTVKDFKWAVHEIVGGRPSAAEISEAAARDEISKGKIEDEFKSILLNGCKGTDGRPETLEPIDLLPSDPGFLARSAPWRPVHQRPKYQRSVQRNGSGKFG